MNIYSILYQKPTWATSLAMVRVFIEQASPAKMCDVADFLIKQSLQVSNSTWDYRDNYGTVDVLDWTARPGVTLKEIVDECINIMKEKL